LITLASLHNSRVLAREDHLYGQAIARSEIQPPLFILGHWRSGTTLLHRLLALNKAFGYLNLYQAYFPSSFLTTEARYSKLFNVMLPENRESDAMDVSYGMPVEEERALSALTGYSFRLETAFPRNAARYERYITFREAPAIEQERWKTAFKWLLRKLTLRMGRPLVLKSPANTARIKMLLQMFPEARFVHIHRNPYDVFQSTRHHMKIAGQFDRLQRARPENLTDTVLRRYQTVHASFFEERELIPPGRLYEVSFEDLEKDPLGEVQKIHWALELPLTVSTKERVEAHISSLVSYRKNVYPPLSSSIRDKIKNSWRRCFEEWGYPT
jgi:hypothetical protein